jgi:hypothetical protein
MSEPMSQADRDTPHERELAELRNRVAKLDERLKENQASLFGAIKTLLDDVQDYRSGKRDFQSLRPAALGLLFAYLRPRLVIVVGSVLAALMGVAQLWLLWNQQQQLEQQNTLIEQQSDLLAAQTKAGQISAITELVLALDPRDSIQSHIAQIQLAESGEIGVNVLIKLSESRGPASALAAAALYDQWRIHSASQASEVLHRWVATTKADLYRVRYQLYTADEVSSLPEFLHLTDGLIQQYLWGLVQRVRIDAHFNQDLRSEFMKSHPPFDPDLPGALADLYYAYYEVCKERSLDFCSSTLRGTPPWHEMMYTLAASLGTDQRRLQPSTAYSSLFADTLATGQLDRSRWRRDIRSWFLEPSVRPVDPLEILQSRP